MAKANTGKSTETFREKWRRIVFGTDTPAGQRFDIVLIYVILASVAVVMLDSVDSINQRYGSLLRALEWGFTLLFTVEYAFRIYLSANRLRYIRSFYGLVDLLAVLPTYLDLLLPQTGGYLLTIRLLRVLRVFRVFKLLEYVGEANLLLRALVSARHKIVVFFSFVFVLATVFGSLMFLVEGPDNGFTSIPKSIYWTIVTITTVGYGDITPQTVAGQFISTLAMLTGYSIIAVPTGIITAHLGQEMRSAQGARVCQKCGTGARDANSNFCDQCGTAFAAGSPGES